MNIVSTLRNAISTVMLSTRMQYRGYFNAILYSILCCVCSNVIAYCCTLPFSGCLWYGASWVGRPDPLPWVSIGPTDVMIVYDKVTWTVTPGLESADESN